MTYDADTLPTKLPTSVPYLPGAFTSASINAKIDQAVAGFQPGVNGFKGAVRITETGGDITVKGIAAVKIADGWAVYGEAALDLHSKDKQFEFGFEGTW